MSNVRQLLDNGVPIYPITDKTLVLGLNDVPFEFYVVAWDGASTPVAANIPAGVSITYDGNTYTGSLAASSATAPYLYLVASTSQQGEYDRYITTHTGSTYAWTALGSTAPVSPVIADNLTTNDASKALSAKQGKILGEEVSELEAKVTDIDTTLSAIFGVESLVTSWESGALNSTTGADLADAYCMRSNFIPVTPGKVYEYWGSTGSAARAILVGYSSNSDSTKTEIVKGVAGQSGSVLQRFIPGSTTNYIRISYQIGYTGDYGVWTEPKEKEDYLLGFFDRDSDFKTYNGIKIYDIYANTIVDTTVRLKIFCLGVTSNHAFVAICKDSGTYPSNCVARYYVPLSDISALSGKQTITIPEYNSSGANFTMVVDIDALKTKANVDQNSLYLNSEYINRKALAAKIGQNAADISTNSANIAANTSIEKITLQKVISGVKEVTNLSRLNVLEAVSSFRITVPDSIKEHEFVLYTLIYNTTYNRLYLTIYDVTNDVADCYGWKQYESRPVSGVENVIFENYSGKQVPSGDYSYEVTLDWEKFNSGYEFDKNSGIILYTNLSRQNARLGMYEGDNTPLESVISDAAMLSGTWTLSSPVAISENQHINGYGCVVYCTNSAKITMSKGAVLENIKFVGPWAPVRESGDGTTYTQYGFVPLITLQDLSSANTGALFGYGNTLSDSLIIIPENGAYNTRINSCRFENFEKPIINAGAERHQSVNNPIISNNYFSDCWLGIAVMGEFERVYDNEFYRCVIGVYMKSGNCNENGDIFKCCDCGIYFPTSSGAHAEGTTLHLCHCGLASIYVKEIDIALGYTFVNCHIADAPVIGEDINTVLFDGCRLDTYFSYTSGARNSIVCSNVRGAYLYGHPIYSVPADTQIAMNRGMGTTTDAQANNQS